MKFTQFLLGVSLVVACRSDRLRPGDPDLPNVKVNPPASADASPLPVPGPDALLPLPEAAAGTLTTPPSVADVAPPRIDASTPPADASFPPEAAAPDLAVDVRPPPVDVRPPPVDLAPGIATPLACGAPSTGGEIDGFDPQEPNCSLPPSSLAGFTAAVDEELYAGGAMCGTCVQVSNGSNKVIAVVVDKNPTLPGSHGHKISLSRAALMKLANVSEGPLFYPWRRVPCPVTGPISAALKEGSTVYWWQAIFQNVTNPIALVEYMSFAEQRWTSVKRESYNYFSQPMAAGLPSRFRLTDIHGNVATTADLVWPKTPVTQPISIGVQFPAACSP